MNDDAQKKKAVFRLATVHLIFWFVVLSAVEKRAPADRSFQIAVMVALVIAAWIQYRSLLALRRALKKVPGPTLPHDGSHLF